MKKRKLRSSEIPAWTDESKEEKIVSAGLKGQKRSDESRHLNRIRKSRYKQLTDAE